MEPQLQDLIQNSQCSYSVQELGNNANKTLNPGETLFIRFPRGNYVLDTESVTLNFRPVFQCAATAGNKKQEETGVCSKDAESLWSCQSVKVSGRNIMANSLNQTYGRSIWTNFVEKQLVDRNNKQQEVYNGVADEPIQKAANDSGAGRFMTGVSHVFYDTNHCYYPGGTNDTDNANKIAHRLALQEQAPFRQRFYQQSREGAADNATHETLKFTTIQTAGVGVYPAAKDEEKYFGTTYCEVKLLKLCPEMQMGFVYMGDKDLEIELLVNSASMALSNAGITSTLANVGEENTIDACTFKIGDMCVYSRKMHIKGGMDEQAKSVFNSVVPLTAVYQHIEQISAQNQTFNIPVQHRHLRAAFIFYTLAAANNKNVDSDTAPGSNNANSYLASAVGDSNLPVANLQYSYDDALYCPILDSYIQIGNKRYKANTAPIPNKQIASYIDQQNALYEVMPTKKLRQSLLQFITNRSVQIIPINPTALQEEMVNPGQNVTFHVEFDTSSRNAVALSKLNCQIYLLASQALTPDGQLQK